jgi:transposase-like protein
MSKRTRRRYTPEQKAALVRQHVVDKKPVSEICNTVPRQPSVFLDGHAHAPHRILYP